MLYTTFVHGLSLCTVLFLLPTVSHAGAIANIASVNGVNISYESQGEGPALVLINDGILDHRMWDDQVKEFSAHYRVIRYDFRGWGKSSSASQPFSLVEDLYALLTSLHIEKAALLGAFVGGEVAIDFAIEHPNLVTSVVVVAPLLHGFRYSPATESWSRTWYALAQAGDTRRLLDMYMNDPALGQRLKENATTRRRLETILRDNLLAYQTDFSRLLLGSDPPALHALPAVHAPTLIISGDNINPDLRIITDMLQHGIHDARQILIPHTGHLANIEQPNEFNRIVLEWLKKQPIEGQRYETNA